MDKAPVPGEVREAELMRMMQTYGGMLAGMCTMLLRDRDLAQDIVQETFVRAWRYMDRLRGGKSSEKAWLCRIAVNLCRDHQRTRWFQLVDRDESALSQLSVPANQPESDVLEAVGALPIRLREVILLHYYQGMDAEEMASTLGVSISAVYRRLRKARGQLKKLLEGADDDE